jgi:predicted short-subunit dehydrogenase-like oxidoreductase (DUF2520 family)
MEGRYRESFLAAAGVDAPKVAAGDMSLISTPVDFVGLNIYLPGSYVSARDDAPGFVAVPPPGQISDGEFDLAQDRSRGALLGPAERGQGMERERHLHHRERLLGDRCAHLDRIRDRRPESQRRLPRSRNPV